MVIPSKHQSNTLDKHIRQMREKCLSQIVKKCDKITNMEFGFVLDELESLSQLLAHLEHEVFSKV